MNAIAERGDPLAHVDELVALFAAAGKPRGPEWFHWYYEDKGFGAPETWLLRSKGSGAIVGLTTLVRRRLRFGDDAFDIGLVGNLLVDANARQGFAARQFEKLIRVLDDRQVQLVVALNPNAAAAKIARFFRFKAVGAWRNHAHIARSGAWLRPRLGPIGLAIGPVVDLAAGARRLLAPRDPVAEGVEVRELGVDEVRRLRLDAWPAPPGRLVGELSATLLEKQFLTYPGKRHTIFAFFVPGSSEPVGVAIVAADEAAGRASIQLVATDHRALSVSQAIRALVRVGGSRMGGVWRVEVIDGSSLQEDLRAAGFLTDPRSNRPNRNSLWVCGLPRTDITKLAANAENWLMFQGFNDI